MDQAIVDAFRAAIGSRRVRTGEAARDERRRDQWVLSHLRDWRGDPMTPPGVVLRPDSVAHVQAIVRAAAEHGTALVPFGLGSGVCGGIAPDADAALVDLGGLDRVREIDPTNQLAAFDAGVRGSDAEAAVAAHGLTIGHWPQSVAISSVGGWVSTRATGQLSTAHGGIEEIVQSIEAVLPDGECVTLGKGPRAAAGPDLRHLLLGAEGTLGIVTGVTLSLRREPEERAFAAWWTPSLAAGFAVQREIVQRDWRPPVMRQYDAAETSRSFPERGAEGRGLLLLVHEGPAARVAVECDAIRALAREGGLEPAPENVALHWWERRNHVPSWEEFFERGLIVDTIEVSASWTRIEEIYHDAVASLRELPSLRAASAHSSHVYRSGLNLYFTFAAHPADPDEMEPLYHDCWRRVMEATVRHGGSLAHHHGVGRVRRPYLESELGTGGVALLRTLKRALDPRGLMNPGTLLPDESSPDG